MTEAQVPSDLQVQKPVYEAIAARAHRADLNDDGIAMLPAGWDDDTNDDGDTE